MSSFSLTLLTILGFIQKSLSVPDHFKSLLEELSGSNLRFSANINAPFFYIKIGQDGTFTYEGFHAEIVAFIAKALNITYSFVYQNVTEANKIGLLESAINQLMRNEVDVVAFAFAMNEDHCTRMDCSTPINALVCVMMVPWPETESRILVPLKPFQANQKAGRCQFTISNINNFSPTLFSTYSVYSFPKNWRYTDAVNSRLQLWRESGLPQLWKKMFLPKNEKCSLENYGIAEAKPRVLTLSDFSGSFVILLFGSSLSLLVFLVECDIGLARRNLS